MCQAASWCLITKHKKDRKHMLSLCVPQGIGGARAISTVKIEEQRPGKRGNVILKLAPPKDQTSAWELNYFLAVGREQRRAECALYLSVEQMAPCNNCGPWPGGMGRGQLQGSFQAWLQLLGFGVSAPLEILPCFGVVVFKFSFWFKIKE